MKTTLKSKKYTKEMEKLAAMGRAVRAIETAIDFAPEVDPEELILFVSNMVRSQIGKSKLYIFNFVSGGWNQMSGNNKAEAIEKAVAKFNNANSKVDVDSFRLHTDAEEKALCSNFY